MSASRVRVGLVTLGALAGAIALTAPIALAAAVDDRKDAPRMKLDIRRASAVQSKGGKIRQEVRYHASTADASGTACIGFYRRKGASRPSHTLCFEYDGLAKPQDNNDSVPSIRKCGRLIRDDFDSATVCDGKITGDADITYRSTRARLSFDPKAIGSPRAYYFAVTTVTVTETAPPSGRFCCSDSTGRRKLTLRNRR